MLVLNYYIFNNNKVILKLILKPTIMKNVCCKCYLLVFLGFLLFFSCAKDERILSSSKLNISDKKDRILSYNAWRPTPKQGGLLVKSFLKQKSAYVESLQTKSAIILTNVPVEVGMWYLWATPSYEHCSFIDSLKVNEPVNFNFGVANRGFDSAGNVLLDCGGLLSKYLWEETVLENLHNDTTVNQFVTITVSDQTNDSTFFKFSVYRSYSYSVIPLLPPNAVPVPFSGTQGVLACPNLSNAIGSKVNASVAGPNTPIPTGHYLVMTPPSILGLDDNLGGNNGTARQHHYLWWGQNNYVLDIPTCNFYLNKTWYVINNIFRPLYPSSTYVLWKVQLSWLCCSWPTELDNYQDFWLVYRAMLIPDTSSGE